MPLASTAAHSAAPNDDDRQHLAEVFALVGCGETSEACAGSVLTASGSLARALALDARALAQWGVPHEASRKIIALRAAWQASLRRDLGERPLIDGRDALFDYLHAAMAHLVVEEVRVLFLDAGQRLIRDEALFRGTVDRCAVYVRQIVARTLEVGACGLVLVHNHPSGSTAPSHDDITMTRSIVEALRPLDVRVYDHLIVGTSGHASLRALGYF